MSLTLFITGTDTHVGKTYVTLGLLRAFNQLGYQTLGIKPVASGCIYQGNKLYNEDALKIQQTASISLPYDKINPFAFELAIAPHLAAAKMNTSLTVANIIHETKKTFNNYPADFYLIEGVGGWHVPLNRNETMADYVMTCKLPVILVVGLRLGCLNHAILTYQAIKECGLPMVGWIANHCEPHIIAAEEMVSTLSHWIKAPFLGEVAYLQLPEIKLSLDPLLDLVMRHKNC